MAKHRFYDTAEEAAKDATRWQFIQLTDDALESPSPIGEAIYNVLQNHPRTAFTAAELVEKVQETPDTYLDEPAHIEAVTAFLDKVEENPGQRHGDPANIGLTLMNLMVMDDRITPGVRRNDDDDPWTPEHDCVWIYTDNR